MTFALVTLSVMAASIYLIYKLTKFFGLGLKYKSLVLCAILSLVVNVAAVVMSPYLDKSHYVRLVMMVLIASGLVTLYNERLCARELPPPALPINALAQEEQVVTGLEAETSPTPQEPEKKNTVAPPKDMSKTRDGAEAADREERETKEPTAKEVPKVAAFAARKENVVGAKSAAKKSPAVKVVTPADELARLDTLDSLLDYAYEQKKLNETDKAIAAYQTALAKYVQDDYVPFIVIDLGNTYKETAAYDEAIKVYREAMTIPIIANNKATRREFANNLAYLRTVRLVLAKHRALDTPFSEIPPALMSEIERTYQARAAKLGLG